MFKKIISGILTGSLMFGTIDSVLAETVYLKDGSKIEGEVTQGEERFKVKTDYGVLEIDKDKVLRIDYGEGIKEKEEIEKKEERKPEERNLEKIMLYESEKKSMGAALALELFLPGGGHFYAENYLAGGAEVALVGVAALALGIAANQVYLLNNFFFFINSTIFSATCSAVMVVVSTIKS